MEKNTYGLTNPQKSILYMEQYFKGTAVNNICGTVFIKEKVNFDKLSQAIHIFLRDNDSFRIRLTLDSNQEFVQYFSDDYVFDSHHIAFLEDVNALTNLENQMAEIPFSLIDSQLFRIQLFQLSNQTGGFIVNAHHLIADACTASLVASKIITIYSSLIKDISPCIEPTSYLKYIQSEQEYISSDKYQKDKEYWESMFNSDYEIATLSSGKNGTISCKAVRKSFILSNDEVKLINEFCSRNKISVFNFFMALYAIYIYKVTDLEQFVLGTPILNRSTFAEKNTPGMFISTMPFQFSVDSSSTFVNFAKDIATNALSMFRHQKYPYSSILEYIRTTNPSQPNLYDILISYQNTKANRNTSDIPYEVRWTFNHHTSDSLDIHISDMNDTGRLNLSYDYQTAKFSDSDIDALHLRIMNMIKQLLYNDNIQIADIKVVTDEEEDYILNHFNHSTYDYDKNLTLSDLFEEQVQKTPNCTAICYAGVSYTYLQLHQLVDTIALRIAEKGLFSKNISVIANKSIKTVASFLAIMKTGNCYIPIDPSYPKDRIDYILENSFSDMTICDKKYSSLSSNCLVLDDIEIDENATFTNLAKPNMLAYMIYTSGSTGKPKGVKIKHKNIVNTLLWRKDYYHFDDSIHVLQIPSFSFDSSVEDIYTPLISGSQLVIPNFERMDTNVICELIHTYDINHFLVVPSLYRVLLSEKSNYLANFKFVTIAGENFNENLVKEHFEKLPNVRLVNEYGPTENSVCSTFYEFSKDHTHIYIGDPIYNCKCFVLNSKLELLPPNVTGELYLSGVGLSDGYLNKEELTAQKFITNSPLAPRLYKTGDLVKYHLHSGLEFIGRNDSQVKLNGFRIELQEISNIILKYNLVKDAVCILKKLTDSNKEILVAYVTTIEGFELEYLNTLLRQSLPYYMIPKVVTLDKFPTTPNGKIDFKALPVPYNEENHIHREPKNDLEKKILDICLDIIPNKNLNVDDDLFTVGLADSLMILTISSKLFAENIKIPTQYFYQYPTIEKLVANKDLILKEMLTNDEIPVLKYQTDVNQFDFEQLHFPYHKIFLTGSTGFLGIHILYYLLLSTNAKILCLVRRKYGMSPVDRLQELFIRYFGNEYLSAFQDRVSIVEGELTEPHFKLSDEDYLSLKSCDCVIHTAAITKHYGDSEIFYHSNILSTKNIVEFCRENKILLNHMSTTSIVGFWEDNNNSSRILTENDFYIGQNYKDNVYVNSKFLSEAIIYKEQYNGLKANVFRLGNLMGRYSDGMFQINKYQNAFYTKLLTIAKLKLVPNDIKNMQLDFSPIDTVSRSIITLLTIPHLENCIFHITNPHVIRASELVNIFIDLGLSLEFTDFDTFVKALSKDTNLMKYFVSDLSGHGIADISDSILIKSTITNQFLENIHFEWPKIDKDYLVKFLTKTDFFNDILK